MDLSFYVWGTLPSGPRAELRVTRTRAGNDALAAELSDLGDTAWRMLGALDRSLSLPEWERSTENARLADAMVLLSGGLCRLRWIGGPSGTVLRPEDLAGRLLRLDWGTLYGLLTHQAKLRLGLVAGFRMVLAIERCQRLSELQALSLLFVDALWLARGEDGIRPVCERLTDQPPH